MRSLFDSFLGFFFIIILMVTGLSIISASITAKNADANLSAYVAEIEESNFSKSVIQAVWKDADSRNYTTTMVLYYEDETGAMTTKTFTASDVIHTDDSGNKTFSISGSTSDVYMVQIAVSFKYNFALYNQVTQHTLYRFAR